MQGGAEERVPQERQAHRPQVRGGHGAPPHLLLTTPHFLLLLLLLLTSTDLRVIDMAIIKGQQDLKEVVEHWKQVRLSGFYNFERELLTNIFVPGDAHHGEVVP